MRDVAQRHLFVSARYRVVVLLEDGRQFLDKRLALLVDSLAGSRHLFLPERQQVEVGFAVVHLQQGVTLLQGFVVAVQCLYIRMVQLRDHHVNQSAALLAASLYQ